MNALDNLPDDMVLPKASYDPKYLHLQKLVTDFVTDFIMKNEKDLFLYVNKLSSELITESIKRLELRDNLLGTKNTEISKLIIDSYTNFFNKLHKEIINKNVSDTHQYYVEKLNDMLEVCDYNISILIIKIYNIIVGVNLDIVRENLDTDNISAYIETVGEEINYILIDRKLILELMPSEEDIVNNKIMVEPSVDIIKVSY